MTIYKDQLEAVYKLIEKPENWTQEYFARNSESEGIEEDYRIDDDEFEETLSEEEMATHPDAVCWCLYGAAYKCEISPVNDIAFASALGFETTPDVTDFNDTHTHAEVLQLLRDAIDRAPVRGEP